MEKDKGLGERQSADDSEDMSSGRKLKDDSNQIKDSSSTSNKHRSQKEDKRCSRESSQIERNARANSDIKSISQDVKGSEEDRNKGSSRKRPRSGSMQNEDEARKRRSKGKRSRSKSWLKESGGCRRSSYGSGREEASSTLQRKINRLKEEIQKAKEELEQDRRDARSQSRPLDQRDRYRTGQRSRSRSKDERNYGYTDYLNPSQETLPFAGRLLDDGHSDNGDEKKVVVVEKVDTRDQSVLLKLQDKFSRYGKIVNTIYDEINSKAFFYYRVIKDAREAVRSMDDRFFEGRYLNVDIVKEKDIKFPSERKLVHSIKNHMSDENLDKVKYRSPVKRCKSPARSMSLELHWPTNPRHPSTQLFDQTRSLSPLSLLISSEALRNGGIRPVSFRPKLLRIGLTQTSLNRFIGPERLAKREMMMMMKQMNGTTDHDWAERSISDFEVLATVGKGTYGQMFKVVDKSTEIMKALKKVVTEDDRNGFPAAALQELRLRGRLDHPNILRFVEVIRDNQEHGVSMKRPGTFYFVYDYMNHDLKRLLQAKSLQLKTDDIVWLIKQLLSALSYCHHMGLVHHDVKPSNILINNRGDLKLSQFSLTCPYDEGASLASSASTSASASFSLKGMVSLWYRAPELLLGEKKSKPAMDIWSCGCVIGEIFSKKPIFLGSDEENQMEEISKVCGSPSHSSWPNINTLPKYYILKKIGEYPRLFHDTFHYLPYMARNLLDPILVMDPQKRISADEALKYDWVKDAGCPRMLPMTLLQLSDCHMLMPAQSSVETHMHGIPPPPLPSAILSLKDQNLDSIIRKVTSSQMIKQDFSDKIAIGSNRNSASAQEAEPFRTLLMSGSSRETPRVPGPDVPTSRGLVRLLSPASFQPKRQTFNPLVTDYDCRPSNSRVGLPSEKLELQPGRSYSHAKSILGHSDQDDRSQTVGEEHFDFGSLERNARSLEGGGKLQTNYSPDLLRDSLDKRPFAKAGSAKATVQSADESTYSAAVADLEQQRTLRRQLELVGKDKYDASRGVVRADGGDESWKIKSKTEELDGRSGEYDEYRIKGTFDVDNRMPMESPNSWHWNINKQSTDNSNSLLKEQKHKVSHASMESNYRSLSSHFQGSWKETYHETEAETTSCAKESQAPKHTANQNVSATRKSFLSTTRDHTTFDGRDYSKPPGATSGISAEWNSCQNQPFDDGTRSLSSPMNFFTHTTGTAQSKDELYLPSRTAVQRSWEGDCEVERQGLPAYSRGESAKSELYRDDRWKADEPWNENSRSQLGTLWREPKLEWRKPQSRF